MMRFSAYRTAFLSLGVLFAMAVCPEEVWFATPATVVAQEGTAIPNAMSVVPNPFSDAPDDSSPFPKIVSSQSAKPSSSSNATSADDAIRKKLLSPCDFNYDEMPFVEIKRELEKKLGVNIVLTSSASDDALTEDETFTSNLSGISYANALRIILADKNATYCIQDGVLKLISLDEAMDQQWFSRRMIDVSETLELIRVAENDRIGKLEPSSVPSGGAYSGGSSGGGAFSTQATAKRSRKIADNTSEIQQLAKAIVKALMDAQPKVERVEKLVTAGSILTDAITKTVLEESWCSNNGSMNLVCVGGVLIVNGNEEVNDKVDGFVKDLTFLLKSTAK